MNRQRLIAIILIAFLGFACYFNSLSSGFIWDDEALVTSNFLIKNTKYIGKIFTADLFNGVSGGSNFYRPMQSLSFMLDYHIWKLNPLGYHLTNIILHIIVAVLIYGFILIISGSGIISLVTALLFVVHPVHVEAVTYVSGRADMLVGLFLLLSLILFAKGRYLVSLISSVCALFSKELALVFPFILLVYVFMFKFPVSKQRPPRNYIYALFFLVSAAFMILRLHILPNKAIFATAANIYLNSLFFIQAIFLYFKTLILPVNLHMAYDVVLPISILDIKVLLSLLGIIFLLYLVRSLYLKQNRFKLVSFGLVWFIIGLLPYSGLFQINAYFAEHFCYLSSIGVFLIIAIISNHFMIKKKIFVLFPVLLIAIYGFATVKYNHVWQDQECFYRRILKFTRGNALVYNNLAAIQEKKADYDEAEKYYLKALQIDPNSEKTILSLCRVNYLKGNKKLAINQLKGFLDGHPDSFWGWANLGSMYVNTSQYDKAIEAYKQSLAINPSIPGHHYYLGFIFKEVGKLDLAIEELKHAISLDDSNHVYHNDLGLLYKDKGLFELAIIEYLSALESMPKSPEVNANLGIVYYLGGDLSKAEEFLLTSINLDNNFTIGYYNLGLVYWQKKDYLGARKQFEAVLGIDPEFSQAKAWLDNLAD